MNDEEKLMQEFGVVTREQLEKALTAWQERVNEENEYYNSFTY